MNTAELSQSGLAGLNADTLIKLYVALKDNPDTAIKGTWEYKRIAQVRKDMQRRGIRAERSAK